jgi:hypothetical protein
LQEYQQLTFLAQKPLYRDWGFYRIVDSSKLYSLNNGIRNEKMGKLICIDTEDRSFQASTGINISGSQCKVILNFLTNNIIKNSTCKFKTRHWLRKYTKHNGKIILGKSLNHSTEYDESGFNFEEVKRQWALISQQFIAEEKVLSQSPPPTEQLSLTKKLL